MAERVSRPLIEPFHNNSRCRIDDSSIYRECEMSTTGLHVETTKKIEDEGSYRYLIRKRAFHSDRL